MVHDTPIDILINDFETKNPECIKIINFNLLCNNEKINDIKYYEQFYYVLINKKIIQFDNKFNKLPIEINIEIQCNDVCRFDVCDNKFIVLVLVNQLYKILCIDYKAGIHKIIYESIAYIYNIKVCNNFLYITQCDNVHKMDLNSYTILHTYGQANFVLINSRNDVILRFDDKISKMYWINNNIRYNENDNLLMYVDPELYGNIKYTFFNTTILPNDNIMIKDDDNLIIHTPDFSTYKRYKVNKYANILYIDNKFYYLFCNVIYTIPGELNEN